MNNLFQHKNFSDYIRVYDNALTPEQCQSLIQSFEDDTAHHIYNDDKFKKFTEINIVQAGWDLTDLSRSALWHRTRYWRDCDITESMIDPEHSWEELRMKRYRVSEQEQFFPHSDVYNYNNARRFLVMFWYLNDVTEGGETVFFRLDQDIKIQPRQGTVIMFPCTWQYLHAGLAPKSNDKYIVGTYLHYQ